MGKVDELNLLKNATDILSGTKPLNLPQFNAYLRFAASHLVLEEGQELPDMKEPEVPD